MQLYRYISGNSIIETPDVNSIPEGIAFESFNVADVNISAHTSVTPRQMRVALIMSGISIASIEAMIDALEEPQKSVVKTTWEYSTVFERENEMLNQMAPLLNLTQSQVDNLFLLAGTL